MIQNWVETKLMQRWFKVDTQLCSNFALTLDQLCVNSPSTFYKSWYTVDTKLSWNKVDTELTQSSCIDDAKLIELLQSWYPALYQTCIKFALSLYYLCINSPSTLKKVDTQLIHNWIDTKLIQSWCKYDIKLAHHFVSTLHQFCVNFVSKLMQSWHRVDSKLMHTGCKVDWKLMRSWYTALQQLCITFVSTQYQLCIKDDTKLTHN